MEEGTVTNSAKKRTPVERINTTAEAIAFLRKELNIGQCAARTCVMDLKRHRSFPYTKRMPHVTICKIRQDKVEKYRSKPGYQVGPHIYTTKQALYLGEGKFIAIFREGENAKTTDTPPLPVEEEEDAVADEEPVEEALAEPTSPPKKALPKKRGRPARATTGGKKPETAKRGRRQSKRQRVVRDNDDVSTLYKMKKQKG